MSITELLEKAKGYLSPPRLATIQEAYDYAARAHAGQRRKSGEPFIDHPVETAYILVELELDASSIVAALLHDVPEDAGIPLSEIQSRFGEEVARLVDGVTKLTKLSQQASGEAVASDTQVENLRKMLVAMAEDIRVVFIKLADRLHNMRTLHALTPGEQRRIAEETLEIYAPLANRLGVWELKWQLEDLAFSYLEPEAYGEISGMLVSRRQEREEFIGRVIAILQAEFAKAGLRAEITGRAKHIYSIHEKIEKYQAIGRDFDDIHDLVAIRVLVSTVTDCYTAVGIVHNLWHPLPGEFDDYIANPKQNGYQSLHTTVMCLGATPLEVQVRTRDMHYIAEYGVAAHWRYKEGEKQDTGYQDKLSWLRQLVEWQRELSGAEEFMESVKTDIFNDQVFVFTPKGEIKNLPKGSTPLDLAYRIHTELGHHTVGAKVNGRMVSLTYTLNNGDVVEILSARDAKGPSMDWLSPHLGYVKSSHARTKIRQWFKKREMVENIERGRKILEKELRHLGIKLSEQEAIAGKFKYEKVDDFLAAIGDSSISTQQIVSRIAGEEKPSKPVPETTVAPAETIDSTIKVLGEGDVLTRLARCCRPVPGDAIIGYITRNRGITVHRTDCYTITREKEKERLVQVDWGKTDAAYPVKIRVEAQDRVGLMRDITTIVAEEKVNITNVSLDEHGDHTVTLDFTLETRGLSQLSGLMLKIERVRGVTGVARIGGQAVSRDSA
ncbi:MAG: bifunctional (p)ppGpp synthetase/guanosine-3',5'-bis(diphosphate) 3'-pyrophosphohydrolase [Chloroflexota bacterium]